jgi:hypothetical protein
MDQWGGSVANLITPKDAPTWWRLALLPSRGADVIVTLVPSAFAMTRSPTHEIDMSMA